MKRGYVHNINAHSPFSFSTINISKVELNFFVSVCFQGDVYLQGEIQDLQQSVSIPDGNLQGEVQILHATPEQISQLQQAHHIQILQGDHIIQVPVPVNV